MSGGALGGVAAGFLWSAQGPYFAKNAELFAIASNGQASEDAINETKQKWAAYFAIPYLGFEVSFTSCTSFTSSPARPY